jgi:membrane-associated phospholipid phosphatase
MSPLLRNGQGYLTRTRLATFISDGLNPLVIGLIILAVLSFDAASTAAAALKWFFLVVGLCFLPVLLIATYLVKTGRMDALFSNRRHQRHRIYVIALFFNVMGMLTLSWLHAPTALVAALASGLVTVVSFAVINLWWKISVHSSVTSALVVILYLLYGWWAAPSLVLIPVMGWARVTLAQHTVGQVAAGSALSAAIVIAVFFQYGVI